MFRADGSQRRLLESILEYVYKNKLEGVFILEGNFPNDDVPDFLKKMDEYEKRLRLHPPKIQALSYSSPAPVY